MLLLCLLAASGRQRCVGVALLGGGVLELGGCCEANAAAAVLVQRWLVAGVAANASEQPEAACGFITSATRAACEPRSKRVLHNFFSRPCKRASSLILVKKDQTNQPLSCREVTLGLEGTTLIFERAKIA